jgi:hypothetical protein
LLHRPPSGWRGFIRWAGEHAEYGVLIEVWMLALAA